VGDTYGNLREGHGPDKSLDIHTDKMLHLPYAESGESRVKRYDVSSNPYPDLATATPEYLTLEEITLWEAGSALPIGMQIRGEFTPLRCRQ